MPSEPMPTCQGICVALVAKPTRLGLAVVELRADGYPDVLAQARQRLEVDEPIDEQLLRLLVTVEQQAALMIRVVVFQPSGIAALDYMVELSLRAHKVEVIPSPHRAVSALELAYWWTDLFDWH